jgi:signal transduction histidine kinase
MLTPLLDRVASRAPAAAMLGGLVERVVGASALEDCCTKAQNPDQAREELCSVLLEFVLLLMADPPVADGRALEILGDGIQRCQQHTGDMDGDTAWALVAQSARALYPLLAALEDAPSSDSGPARQRLLTAGPAMEPGESRSGSSMPLLLWAPDLRLALGASALPQTAAHLEQFVRTCAQAGDLWVGAAEMLPSPLPAQLLSAGVHVIVRCPEQAVRESGIVPVHGGIACQMTVQEYVDSRNPPWRWAHAQPSGQGSGTALRTSLSTEHMTARQVVRIYRACTNFRTCGLDLLSALHASAGPETASTGCSLLLVAGNLLSAVEGEIRMAAATDAPPPSMGPDWASQIQAVWPGMRVALGADDWALFRHGSEGDVVAVLGQLAEGMIGPVPVQGHTTSAQSADALQVAGAAGPDLPAWPAASGVCAARPELLHGYRRMAEALRRHERDAALCHRLQEVLPNARAVLQNMRQESDIHALIRETATCLKELGIPVQGYAIFHHIRTDADGVPTGRWLLGPAAVQGGQRIPLVGDAARLWLGLAAGRVASTPELSAEQQRSLCRLFDQPVQSLLDLPIVGDHRLWLVHADARAFASKDVELARQLVEYLQLGIARMEGFRSAAARVQQAHLTAMGLPLIAQVDELLPALAHSAMGLLDAESVVLYSHDASGDRLRPCAHAGLAAMTASGPASLPVTGMLRQALTGDAAVLAQRTASALRRASGAPPLPASPSQGERAADAPELIDRGALACRLGAMSGPTWVLVAQAAQHDFSARDGEALERWCEGASWLLELRTRSETPETWLTERQAAEDHLNEEYRIRDAESAIYIQIALMVKPEHLFSGVMGEIEKQLRKLGVAYETCTTQIFGPEGTNFLSFTSVGTEAELRYLDLVTGPGDWSRIPPHGQQFPWVGEVWRTQQARLTACPWRKADWWGTRTLLDVPFCQGTLGLNGIGPHPFGERDMAIAERCARIFSLAYERCMDLILRQRANAALRDSQERLEEFSRRLLRFHEAERHSVARDLHDGVSQILSAAQFNLAALANRRPHSNECLADINRVRSLLGDAVNDIRQISHDLRPSILDDLGLEAAARSLCEDFAGRNQVRVGRDWCPHPPSLHKDAEIALYRILQEALHNVEKHARAHGVDVSLAVQDRDLVLRIRDDGRGFPLTDASLPPNGSGLANIKDRAALLGGAAAIRSEPGKGTEVEVRVPMPDSASNV